MNKQAHTLVHLDIRVVSAVMGLKEKFVASQIIRELLRTIYVGRPKALACTLTTLTFNNILSMRKARNSKGDEKMRYRKKTTKDLTKLIQNKQSSSSDKINALQELHQRADPSSTTIFKEVLENPTQFTSWQREVAAQALGKLGAIDAIPALLVSILDEDSEVSWFSALSLGKLGKNSVKGLVEILSEHYPYVSTSYGTGYCAVEALIRIGLPGLLEVSTLLSHKEKIVRDAGARVINSIDHPDALPSLLTIAKDTSIRRPLRQDAIDTLGGIGEVEPLKTLIGEMDDWALDKRVEEKIASIRLKS